MQKVQKSSAKLYDFMSLLLKAFHVTIVVLGIIKKSVSLLEASKFIYLFLKALNMINDNDFWNFVWSCNISRYSQVLLY